MSKKNKSIKAEYDKIRITGWQGNPYSSKQEKQVSISLRELGYDGGSVTDVNFTIKEAKQIITLIEEAIKEANKKEKK